MLALTRSRSFVLPAATLTRGFFIRYVDPERDRTGAISVRQPIRHYSCTPPLSRRFTKRTKQRYSQNVSRRNEALDRMVPRSDRIEALRQKILDISEGREPQQPGETEEPPRREPKPNHYNAFDEDPMPKLGRKGKSKRQFAKGKPEVMPQDAFFFEEEMEQQKPRRKAKKQHAKARLLPAEGDQFTFEEEAESKPRRKSKRKGKQLRAKAGAESLLAPYSVFISCLPGLEPLLLEEVQYLEKQWGKGPSSTKKMTRTIPGGVRLVVPSLGHLYTLHLYLGTASHIYLRLNDDNIDGVPPLFSARGFPELKRKLKDLIISQQWDSWLNIPHRNNANESNLPWQLQVHVTTSKSKLMHTKAVEERVRETIGDVLGIRGLANDLSKEEKGTNGTKVKKPGKDERERPIVRLLVRIERDVVQLSLDTSASSSATPLHMRGYRLNPFKAPLREDLAFALVMAGGVKPRWNLQPLQPLLSGNAVESRDQFGKTNTTSSLQLFDPFCGSGTIAIEGCSILAGLPPGRFRPPPLQGTNLCNPKLWEEMKTKALSCIDVGDNSGVLVAANDINKQAIGAAKSNAKRAGVEGLIRFSRASFKVHPLLKPSQHQSAEKVSERLCVITNPPYGKRLSTPGESKPSIYKELAKALISSPHMLQCTLIGNDPKPLRESALPLKVAFSTKQGGMNVLAMSGSVDNHRN